MYRIHINQQHIKENADKQDSNLPVITVWDYTNPNRPAMKNVHNCKINGPCRIVYDQSPKSSHKDQTVRVWIETEGIIDAW